MGLKKELKNISHLGSLIADWAATEMFLRAGILKERASYIVIKNHTYAHEHEFLLDRINEHITHEGFDSIRDVIGISTAGSQTTSRSETPTRSPPPSSGSARTTRPSAGSSTPIASAP